MFLSGLLINKNQLKVTKSDTMSWENVSKYQRQCLHRHKEADRTVLWVVLLAIPTVQELWIISFLLLSASVFASYPLSLKLPLLYAFWIYFLFSSPCHTLSDEMELNPAREGDDLCCDLFPNTVWERVSVCWSLYPHVLMLLLLPGLRGVRTLVQHESLPPGPPLVGR